MYRYTHVKAPRGAECDGALNIDALHKLTVRAQCCIITSTERKEEFIVQHSKTLTLCTNSHCPMLQKHKHRLGRNLHSALYHTVQCIRQNEKGLSWTTGCVNTVQGVHTQCIRQREKG